MEIKELENIKNLCIEYENLKNRIEKLQNRVEEKRLKISIQENDVSLEMKRLRKSMRVEYKIIEDLLNRLYGIRKKLKKVIISQDLYIIISNTLYQIKTSGEIIINNCILYDKYKNKEDTILYCIYENKGIISLKNNNWVGEKEGISFCAYKFSYISIPSENIFMTKIKAENEFKKRYPKIIPEYDKACFDTDIFTY